MGENNKGPSWQRTMRPTNFADPWLTVLAYTPRVTFCIHVPMFDANEPNQRMRKSRLASAERTVPG
jgi:hypothetical protein